MGARVTATSRLKFLNDRIVRIHPREHDFHRDHTAVGPAGAIDGPESAAANFLFDLAAGDVELGLHRRLIRRAKAEGGKPGSAAVLERLFILPKAALSIAKKCGCRRWCKAARDGGAPRTAP